MRTLALLLGGLLVLAAFAPPVLAEEGEAPAVERPKTNLLRWKEDWSVLEEVDRLTSDDWWDRIKYIPLTKDKETWLSVGGHVGARVEAWNNFGFGDGNDDAFLLGRIWLHADFHARKWLRVFVEGKSALSTKRDLPGGTRTIDVDVLDLQQGFVDFSLDLDEEGTGITLRIGRQQFLFGNQRLVSPLPWVNSMRTWDGVAVVADVGTWNIHGFWSMFVPVKKYEFNWRDQKRQFWGIYATSPIVESIGAKLDVYVLGLHQGRDVTFNGTTGHEDRYTVGARFFGKLKDTPLDYDGEAAYQFGRVGSGAVQAFMIALEAGYRFAQAWSKPRVHLGFDYASGDSTAGGDVETFNQIFPLAHKYYGFIDLIGRQNAAGVNVGVTMVPVEKSTLRLAVHYFWRASDQDALYGVSGAASRAGSAGTSTDLGWEVDLTFRYRFCRHLWGEFGYCHFFAGEFIGESGPDADVDFVYIWFVYTF